MILAEKIETPDDSNATMTLINKAMHVLLCVILTFPKRTKLEVPLAGRDQKQTIIRNDYLPFVWSAYGRLTIHESSIRTTVSESPNHYDCFLISSLQPTKLLGATFMQIFIMMIPVDQFRLLRVCESKQSRRLSASFKIKSLLGSHATTCESEARTQE